MALQILALVTIAAAAVVLLGLVSRARRRSTADRRQTRAILTDQDLTTMRARQARLARSLPPAPRRPTRIPMGVGVAAHRDARRLLDDAA